MNSTATLNTYEKQILDLSILQMESAQRVHYMRQAASLINRSAVYALQDTPPAEAPSPTSLTDILNGVIKAPGTTSIATAPVAAPDPSNPASPDNALYALLAQIQTLDSYISVLTAFCIYNDHPAPYDISDPAQATAFTKAQAKWRNFVLTGGTVKALAAYLPVAEISQQSMSKQVMSTSLHLEFLQELFGDFGFSDSATKQMDGILTNITSTLANLNGSFESASETMDHLLSYYFFELVQGTGGTTSIPPLYVAKMRLFYLQIDQSSWRVSVGKSSAEKIQFNMNYYDMTTTMAAPLVASNMDNINSTIQTLTGQDAIAVNKLMNMQAVTSPPQNAS